MDGVYHPKFMFWVPCNISAVWDEIRNCFQKAVFGVLNDSEQADSSSLKEKDFQPL